MCVLGLSGIGMPLWDLCECLAEFGDIAMILEYSKKYLLLNEKDVGLPRAEKRMETWVIFSSNANLLYDRNK